MGFPLINWPRSWRNPDLGGLLASDVGLTGMRASVVSVVDVWFPYYWIVPAATAMKHQFPRHRPKGQNQPRNKDSDPAHAKQAAPDVRPFPYSLARLLLAIGGGYCFGDLIWRDFQSLFGGFGQQPGCGNVEFDIGPGAARF